VIRYAITSGVEGRSPEALLADARAWVDAGLEWVQLREKWMTARELTAVARAMAEMFREAGGRTNLLVNGRADVAVAAGADGVHLTARTEELTPEQVRRLFAGAGCQAVIGVSCHSIEEVRRACEGGADLIVFGPVFEKRVEGAVVVAGVGLGLLRDACKAAEGVPVVALGGVTEENVARCLERGAAGVAGIRLFA
jgi:thiamine-phosphate pyrophosphorylase